MSETSLPKYVLPLTLVFTFVAQLLTASNSIADEDKAVLVDLEKAQSRFWIIPQKPANAKQPFFLHFIVLPGEYSGSARLDIEFELPDGHYPGDIDYRLIGSRRDWPIDEHVHRSGNRFEIYLPALEADRKTEFRIGWKDAPFEESRANVLLITDSGHTDHQYVGWRLR